VPPFRNIFLQNPAGADYIFSVHAHPSGPFTIVPRFPQKINALSVKKSAPCHPAQKEKALCPEGFPFKISTLTQGRSAP
jgi:hypothetical protein